MANFVITSSQNSTLVEIDGKKAAFQSGDIRPYTPDGSGNIVFLYEKEGVLKNMGRASSVNDPNLSGDRIIITIGTDTINIDGTTVFADADALLEALREVFFLARADSPLIRADQRVDTFAELPDPTVFDGEYWVVDQKTGTWILGTRREAGIYKAVSAAWVYRGADVPYYLMDDQFTIKDSADNTKQLGFEVGNISPLNRRIATWQDKDGEVAYSVDFLGALNSGLFTGGLVTINSGDDTKFDVSAGTGVVISWTNPAAPTKTPVSWGAFLAQDIPDLTKVFTSISINAAGGLVIHPSGETTTPAENRSEIRLQSAVHTSGVNITSITSGNRPAYEVVASILDYISDLGPVNQGNDYSANGANLQLDKSAGQTTLPFINRIADPQNPTRKTNVLQNIVSTTRTYRDGSGGFVFLPGNTEVDPDFWDDGTGTLNTVSPNKWTTKRLLFFGLNEATTITYGQAEYNSLAEAEDAILTETPFLSPLLGNGSFTTVLIVKVGATDLTDITEAKFICLATR